jgi:hypothetical protein
LLLNTIIGLDAKHKIETKYLRKAKALTVLVHMIKEEISKGYRCKDIPLLNYFSSPDNSSLYGSLIKVLGVSEKNIFSDLDLLIHVDCLTGFYFGELYFDGNLEESMIKEHSFTAQALSGFCIQKFIVDIMKSNLAATEKLMFDDLKRYSEYLEEQKRIDKNDDEWSFNFFSKNKNNFGGTDIVL